MEYWRKEISEKICNICGNDCGKDYENCNIFKQNIDLIESELKKFASKIKVEYDLESMPCTLQWNILAEMGIFGKSIL